MLGPDGAAQRRDVDPVRQRLGGADQQGRGVEPVAQVRRQHRGDLRQGVAGRCRQRAVGPPRHPAHAEDEGLDLLLAEHQRRQGEARAQDVAEARLALDRRSLRLEAGDVPVEGTQADAGLLREMPAADGLAMAPQDLEQIEQAFGTGHDRAGSGRIGRRSVADGRPEPKAPRPLSA
ncbi:hypothetical protein A5481_21060 [Methylobacterium platani]|uniref:Uncharacterized protein n=1 Tax=Methylobacterium platani TaxID=427683 RepID=A0A179S4Q9_9HYPH|nr:hypothetical protein A5481_21060 [Methylobacterium platani]